MLLLCRPPEGGQNSGHRVACFDHLVGNRLNCVRCSEWYWKSFWIVWLWIERRVWHHAHLGCQGEETRFTAAMVIILIVLLCLPFSTTYLMSNSNCVNLHLNMAQSRPLFLLFCPFYITIQIKIKHRFCAWDLNPAPQDGRGRWIHWAGATAANCQSFLWHSESNDLSINNKV